MIHSFFTLFKMIEASTLIRKMLNHEDNQFLREFRELPTNFITLVFAFSAIFSCVVNVRT